MGHPSVTELEGGGEDAVEPLDEGGGVGDGDAFEDEGLVEEEPGGVLRQSCPLCGRGVF